MAAASNNFILTAQGAADAQKTIGLPGGQISEGQTVTVNFKNGHAMIYNNPMTLNNILVVSNQNGTLAPIPRHAMTVGGQTVYKVLDPNTILSVFYTADYDGNQTPAFVIVGNPLVLSSATYSIYANGQIGNEQVATVRSILSNNVPYGWLLCDATVRNRADYPKLWDEIPPVFKNTANNTFVINLQDRAIMGASVNNPLGLLQSDATAVNGLKAYMSNGDIVDKNDTRRCVVHDDSSPYYYENSVFIGATSDSAYGYLMHVRTLVNLSSSDTETRSKNVRSNWIIKAM